VNQPSLSVIISVHDRMRFLPEALESVLSQSLSAAEYEIILVAYNLDPPIRASAEARGARVVMTTAMSLGPKLAEAVQTARGSILVFLEDDDLFEPTKLRRVQELFARRPRMGYYHNGHVKIDESGVESPRKSSRSTRRGTSLEGDPPIRCVDSAHGYGQLAPYAPAYNLSSISIRSEILAGRVEYLERIHLAADIFVFFAALASNWELCADRVELTRVRTHGASASNPRRHEVPERIASLREFLQANFGSFDALREMVVQSGYPQVLRTFDAYVIVQHLIQAFRESTSDRRTMAHRAGALLQNHDGFVLRSFRPVLPAAIVYVLAPGLARAGYAAAKALGL
jgi:glycosyltransferase involved in cell wall biosynthesis